MAQLQQFAAHAPEHPELIAPLTEHDQQIYVNLNDGAQAPAHFTDSVISLEEGTPATQQTTTQTYTTILTNDGTFMDDDNGYYLTEPLDDDIGLRLHGEERADQQQHDNDGDNDDEEDQAHPGSLKAAGEQRTRRNQSRTAPP